MSKHSYKYSKVLDSHINRASQDSEENPDGLQMDESENQGPNDLSKSQPQTSEAFVEIRFCTVCQVEQPLRTKHCRDCNACVVLHDHHCPWLGSCIGEKNRRVFWWYLLFEAAALWMALELSVEVLNSLSVSASYGLALVCVVLVAMFALMVSVLLGFHTYLACANKTTWEVASWTRIGYLSQWPSKVRSPFSQGPCWNLYFFCCKPLSEGYTEWSIPLHPPQSYCCC